MASSCEWLRLRGLDWLAGREGPRLPRLPRLREEEQRRADACVARAATRGEQGRLPTTTRIAEKQELARANSTDTTQ